MYKKDFVEFLNTRIEKYNLKPERFCIGLTEIESHPNVQKMIKKLKKAGYDISCIKGNSVDKAALLSAGDTLAGEWIIDRSLVKGLGSDKTSMILTKSIIALAKELNIHIVSKDVEEKVEADYLSKYGCDVAYGKYFTKPLKPSAFMEYALANTIEQSNTYIYELEGNLADINGKNEGKFIGKEDKFVYDEELKKQIVRFTGEQGSVYENTIELPKGLLETRNYSISVSFRADTFNLWSAIVQIDYENGFASIMPYAWDGVAMFRVKDFMYEDEWHDAIGKEIKAGQWHYITATYNARKQESRLYVDGELQATTENVHTVEHPTRVIIGGDAWQGNIKGDVGHIVIHDYVITADEVKSEYIEYVGKRLSGFEDN
jgi:hypothetical protein